LARAPYANDAGMRDELLGNLRSLLELDRGLGLEWMGRGGLTTASASTRPEIAATAWPTPVIPTTRVAEGADPAIAPVSLPNPPPSPAPVQAPDGEPATLNNLARTISACRACGLCATRANAVPGAGAATAEVVFIGEIPSAEDDASGQPFAGKDGELLTKMILAMGLSRDQVFITSTIKCRPPASRAAVADEVAACIGHLHRQLALIRPKVICTLGNLPLRALLGDETLGVTRLRGTRLDYRGTPLIPTFHPAFLLRNEAAKKPCWDDLKQVLAILGRTPPARV